MKKLLKNVIASVLVIIAAVCVFSVNTLAADEGRWITAWSTSITDLNLDRYENMDISVGDITARTVISPSASGSEIRIKFSNLYGSKPLTIKKATVAKSTGISSVDTDTFVQLTFSGKSNVTVPAGEEVYCDEVKFNVTAGEDIAVSTYLKEFSHINSAGLSGATTYVPTAKGDKTRAEDLNILSNGNMDAFLKDALNTLFGYVVDDGFLEVPLSAGLIKVVPVISDVEVFNVNTDAYSVVIIGDSTVANDFPAYLAQAVNSTGITDIGISAKGLIGNKLLSDGIGYGSSVYGKSLLSRMKRDILGADGKNSTNVKYVVVKIGAEDIIHPVCKEIEGNKKYSDVRQPTAKEIINGYKKFFGFCHDNGIKVIAAGITQWKNTERDYFGTGVQYDRTAQEFEADWKIAKDVNKWLSTTAVSDGYSDGYINLPDISKNSSDPDAFPSNYTTDGINPTTALQRHWADKFPLKLIGVTNRADGVKLSESSLTIYKGDTATLKATVIPSEAENKSVKWESSDTSIATVSSKGKITAKGAGKCKITVTTKDKGYSGVGYSKSCTVTVRVKPESVTVSGESSVYVSKELQLKATVLPKDTYNKKVKWTSSDTDVATVSSKGLVKGVGSGTAIITATSDESSKIQATFKVKVKKKVSVESVVLNTTKKTVYTGDTLKLKATVNPEKATFPELKWKSSDKKIATVDSKGVVTLKKEGKVTITCSSADNPLCKASCVLTVKVKTTGVSISEKKLTMYATQEIKLSAKVLPTNATDKGVTWKSSDKKVASVAANGLVKAKKAGECTITVKTNSGKHIATCKIKVKKYYPVKKLSLEKTSVTIKDGKTYQLETVFSPSKASNKSVKWKSSDKSVATVSSKGVITAVNPGTCTITGESKDSGKKVTCKVKVKNVAVKGVKFKEETYTVNCGGTLKLKSAAVISPSNATNQKLTWKSSNPDYATVSSKGTVEGLEPGKKVTITATTKDGKFVAKCKVKVVNVPLKAIKLNKTTVTMGVGGSATLTPKFTPSNASDKRVTWVSSDTKIATVSAKGVVKPRKDGTCEISCVSKDGGYVAVCTVTVKTVKATNIALDQFEVYVDKGGRFTLNATITPANTTNKKVTWSSTKTSVCTVSSAGVVTAVGTGTCNIKATTANGALVATCKVTVVG